MPKGFLAAMAMSLLILAGVLPILDRVRNIKDQPDPTESPSPSLVGVPSASPSLFSEPLGLSEPTATPDPTPSPSPSDDPTPTPILATRSPVFMAKYQGIVAGMDGSPVVGACVYTGPASGCPRAGYETTNALGYFAVDLPSGSAWAFNIEETGYQPLLQQSPSNGWVIVVMMKDHEVITPNPQTPAPQQIKAPASPSATPAPTENPTPTPSGPPVKTVGPRFTPAPNDRTR